MTSVTGLKRDVTLQEGFHKIELTFNTVIWRKNERPEPWTGQDATTADDSADATTQKD